MSEPGAIGTPAEERRAVAIAIGNELLSGRTADSNFVELARMLGEIGVRFHRHLTIGDDRAVIRAALAAEAPGASLIVVTGGLGPTADDLTREAIADFAGVPLREDPATAARLAARYAEYGRSFEGTARRQALQPEGVTLLPNPVGLAPGLWLEREGGVICAFPGVPGEFRRMVRESLIPRLLATRRFPETVTAVVRTVGLPESEIADRLEAVGIAELAYLPHSGTVDLRLVARGPEARAQAAAFATQVSARLGAAVYGHGEETLAEVVGRQLREQGLSLAVAESCTGGLLGAELTRAAGASDYFLGGVIAYANAVKIAQLQVPAALLTTHGAVSAEVAMAMASGVRKAFGSDLGLAVTGIAGPSGGTPEKPVGRVFLGLATAASAAHRQLDLRGERTLIQDRAALFALDFLRRHLLAERPPAGRD